MSKITFVFGNHNHQPIGNFESVFEEAYQKSYRPFLEVLFEHPSIHWNLHCTGILWEWMENNHPEYLDKVSKMVQRKQLELLSGGFYEPILPIISDRDKVGQIQKLNLYLKDRFSITPKGMWCAERVWEPHLPKAIHEAQIEYTVLDDNHFKLSGLKEEMLRGYYKVEEQNRSVDIFPISKDLRYAIPFKEPEEVLEIFKNGAQQNSLPNPCLTLMDDGEKFGLWPDTYKSVYKEKWLEKFIVLLENNSDWISTKTFSEVRAETCSLGKTYIPCASYSEMMEWSNGFWRNFLAKYPESNWMHKKMLRLSEKIQNIKDRTKKSSFKHLSGKIEAAQNFVWAGQCNCAYWHGIFGGLYLPVLRGAIYQNLIRADSLIYEITQELDGESNTLLTERMDLDGDGKEELLLETAQQNLYFALEAGGTLVEWDFKPQALHISNLMNRRVESYHEKLKTTVKEKTDSEESAHSIHNLTKSKEEGLENKIYYDWYKRANLVDHFLHPNTDLNSFQKCNYGEQGNFVGTPYECKLNRNGVQLSRNGMVWIEDKKKDVLVSKEIEILKGFKKSNHLKVNYSISSSTQQTIQPLWFAPEFCFSFSVFDPKMDRSQKGVRAWERVDPYLGWKMTLNFSSPTDLWIFPLETVTNSEGGFEKTFQGLILLPNWKFSLESGKSFDRELDFLVEKI